MGFNPRGLSFAKLTIEATLGMTSSEAARFISEALFGKVGSRDAPGFDYSQALTLATHMHSCRTILSIYPEWRIDRLDIDEDDDLRVRSGSNI